MLPITQSFLTNHNRPALRDANFFAIRKLKGIIAHWTANTSRGADARANRNYFNTTNISASAHYVIDDHSIIQCLPDNEVGFHVGARFYRPIGEMIKEGALSPNFFLIGFEMCVNVDGDWQKTYRNSVELTQYLLNKHKLTLNELYRHYDITGKLCPKMMVEEADWQAFKRDVGAGLNIPVEHPIKQGKVNTAELNVRKGPGGQFPIMEMKHQNDPVEIFEQVGNWLRIAVERWVHKDYIEITFTQKEGLVDDPTGLNVRSGPGPQFPTVEVLPNGTPVIIEDQQGNWYKLNDNRWAFHKLIKIMELKTGRIKEVDFLNVRKGPGTNFEIVRKLQNGTLVHLLEKEGRWYRVGVNEWAIEAYIEVID